MKFSWAAKDLEFSEPKWKIGEPTERGNCVYLEARNTTENTNLIVGNCEEKRRFICEVSITTLFGYWPNISIMVNY
jgi:hypothetical protein